MSLPHVHANSGGRSRHDERANAAQTAASAAISTSATGQGAGARAGSMPRRCFQ
jgi:hypothetical protein